MDAREKHRKILQLHTDWSNLLLSALIKLKDEKISEWKDVEIAPIKISVLDLSFGIYKVKTDVKTFTFCRYNSDAWERTYLALEAAIKKREKITISFLTAKDGTEFIFKS